MLNERLQILLTAEQRRRLDEEARRRGVPVAQLVREAIDRRFPPVNQEDRRRALEEIEALEGQFIAPDELNRIVEEERDIGFRELFEPGSP
jgi:predicted DNA-binding protein